MIDYICEDCVASTIPVEYELSLTNRFSGKVVCFDVHSLTWIKFSHRVSLFL